MAGTTQAFEEILNLQAWEAAFYAIRDSDDLYEQRHDLESEFEINFDDMATVIELPHDSLSDFRKKITFTVTEHLNSVRGDLYRKVCEEFEYCKKRESFGAKALEALILMIDLFETGGIAYFIFFGFKSGFFDQLCKCGK